MSAEDRADNVEGYAVLRSILDEAYDQSARGKGHDRHANGRYFDQQPIMEIGRMVGPGFATGQVMKKAQEATSMAARGEADAAVRELLGVIVYAASAVALVREKAPRADVDRRRFDATGCAGRARPATDDSDRRRLEAASADRPFQIEAGKFYRTRTGKKVGPMRDSGRAGYPWTDKRNCRLAGFVRDWCDDGRFHMHKGEMPEDIVAEWVDEPAAAN